MNIDWTIPIGFILTMAVQLVVIAFLTGMAYQSILRRIDTVAVDIKHRFEVLAAGDISALHTRVKGVEEWQETLRSRTHTLAGAYNACVLRLALMDKDREPLPMMDQGNVSLGEKKS